jgi:radical SAM superfamily enzyme YgiQ (UPF0313 family)
MRYEGAVYRPPSEARSYILQVTIGCSHNACTFCDMFRDKRFRVRPFEEIKEDIDMAKKYYGPNLRRVFLADGDALVLKNYKLIEIVNYLKKSFPKLERIGIYGNPRGIIMTKSVEELKELKKAGITMVYMGIESGDPEILKSVNKGVTVEEMVEAGRRVKQGGIPLSVTIILGLGGTEKLVQNAEGSAEVINQIDPDYVGALTLLLRKGTPYYDQVMAGKISVSAPYDIFRELRILVEKLEVSNCVFRSNHASNYFPIGGTLPQDKERMLRDLDLVLANDELKSLPPDFHRML